MQRKQAPTGALPFLDVMLKAETQATAAAGVSDASGALPHLARIQESFGPEHNLSGVRAGVGGDAGHAAAAIGAEAYATSDRIAFQKSPDLHTAAHEAAHVVQQRSGIALDGGVGKEGDSFERQADSIADRVVKGESSADLLPKSTGTNHAPVQMRRVPGNVDSLVDKTTSGDEPANVDAHRNGLRVVIDRAEAVLRNADAKHGSDWFKVYMTEAMAGLPADEVVEPGDLLVRKSKALTKVAPALSLGDPSQFATGARRGTHDASNMRKLVRNANKIFDAIASGSRDTDLEDVFGAVHVATAKRKYANARRELRQILADDEILTDRSGFSGEVDLGGSAWHQGPINVASNTIDAPDDPDSIRLIIHESMHAGNAEIHDGGNYVDSGAPFTAAAATVKLTNAAHYEVVPRRILGLPYAYAGVKFVPAGTTSGGVTAAPLSTAMQAQLACATELRDAWWNGVNISGFVRDVLINPRLWTTRYDKTRYSTLLRFWSRVLKLTIHEKTTIDPRSHDPAKRPVSAIDMALIEGVTRKLSIAQNALPGDEAAIAKFEEAHSTEAERAAAHASVEAHRDFLKRLVLGLPVVAPITGSVDRDMGVLTELATRTWDQIANPAADSSDDSDTPPTGQPSTFQGDSPATT